MEYSSSEQSESRSIFDKVLDFVRTIIFVTIFFCLFPSPVFAHVLKTDGSIGAVLHVDPGDDPIAKQVSNFFFEFKDTQNKFTIENCTCTFSVSENGKEIYSQAMTSPNVSFTFPQKDVYQVKVDGKTFSLVYDVRVAREATGQAGQNNFFSTYIIYVSVGIAMVLLAVFFGIQKFMAYGKMKK